MERKGLIRAVIVQDYCLLRKALAERLDREAEIEVCGHASGMEDARRLISAYGPDVVLMNISLRSPGGFVRLKQLRRDFKKIRILTFSCDPEFEHLHAELAMHAGASGYVSSADNEETLIYALHAVADGDVYVSGQLQNCRAGTKSPKTLYGRLSRREVEVFCLTGYGHVPKAIAEKLNLSVKTIESYRERIRDKMGLRDGAELLYAASSFMRKSSFSDHRSGAAVLEATLRQAG